MRPSSHGLIQTLLLMWRLVFRKGKAAMPSGEQRQQQLSISYLRSGAAAAILTFGYVIAGSTLSGCRMMQIPSTQVRLHVFRALATAAIACSPADCLEVTLMPCDLHCGLGV
eukprot:GHRQ01029493.1.p1 GENE.GHRQ01029493.1~~GHRQ01029493.1.p1  ORF type:complete len:112 (-),score=23.05 GHRQ01029493.1:23-358(-)